MVRLEDIYILFSKSYHGEITIIKAAALLQKEDQRLLKLPTIFLEA